jgi:formylglycine-generating enzyme
VSRVRILNAWALIGCAAGCAGRPLDAPAAEVRPSLPAAPNVTSVPIAPAPTAPAASEPAGPEPDAGAAPVPTATGQACPAGMAHVRFDHCPKLLRRCLDKEYDKPNRITICNRFATTKPECKAPRVALDFCIDEYEYPNRSGAKPPVMLNFFEASNLCAAEHKRLCYEREWVTACEGPEEKPFPYGYMRSSKQCNFDNRWVDPHLSRVYSEDPDIQRTELERLDRSMPSGQMPGCVSDYGVHDLTGNVAEWTLADHDRPRARAKFSALKGGAWGHVRNACRPVTTSHAPDFRYYFIGFRCCTDASAGPPRD